MIHQGTLAAAKSVPLNNEVNMLKGQLARLESQRMENDGLFAGTSQEGVVGVLPPGQTLCASLMHRCYDTIASLEIAPGEEEECEGKERGVGKETGVGEERGVENGHTGGVHGEHDA